MKAQDADCDSILYVGLVTGGGGDALQMLDLAAGMAARGRTVSIVVPEVGSTAQFAEQCLTRGVAVERSPRIRADVSGPRQDVLQVVSFVRAHRGPILHIHTGNDCLPRSFLLALAALRAPKAFVTLHGPYASLRPGDVRARAWSAAAPRRFHKVLCPSEHSVRTQIEYGLPVDLLACIRNGVDIARYRAGDARSAYVALGLSPGTPLVMFTSRLDLQKRPVDAVRAFALVATEFADAHLVFVGTGPLQAEVAAAANESALGHRVHFLGFRTDIPNWLAAATAWVMPTESENFSVAIVEALAAGCVVLSTRCSGNDEILVHDDNALTFDVGDVGTLASHLRAVLSSPGLRARLSRSAALTAERYDITQTVAAYADCYDRAAAPRET